MLATADKKTDQAISSIWQLTEDEKIRDQILYREEMERENNHIRDKLKTLEEVVSDQSGKIKDQNSKIKEQEQIILELKAKLDKQKRDE